MLGSKSDIYRKRALENISSPEKIDELMVVVRPQDWMLLWSAAALLVVVLIWSVVGRIPTTVTGRGVFVIPRRVLDCPAPASGRLELLGIRVGDVVRPGQVIGHIDQGEIWRRVQENRSLLVELQAQHRAKSALQSEQMRLHREQYDLARKTLQLQARNFQTELGEAERMESFLKKRLESLRHVKDLGLIAETAGDLVDAEKDYANNQGKISLMYARLQQVQDELKQTETSDKGFAREIMEATTQRQVQMRQLEGRIAEDEAELRKSSEVRCDHGGRVVEVAGTPGQYMIAGTPVARMDTSGDSASLVGLLYFSVGDGKKIRPGMPVQITPDTVERQRFGGIVGSVNVVSPFPVSREGAVSLIGSVEVAQKIMPPGAYIQVTADLEGDSSTYSGYRWSASKGPELKLSPGTTNSVRVAVEERAPITYLLPFLRSVSGTY